MTPADKTGLSVGVGDLELVRVPPEAPSSVAAAFDKSSFVGLLPSSVLGTPVRVMIPAVEVPKVNPNVGATAVKA